MIEALLPGDTRREKIGAPLKLEDFIPLEDNVPIPPNEVVDDATSDLVWKGVERNF
jgi:hypothetical protein